MPEEAKTWCWFEGSNLVAELEKLGEYLPDNWASVNNGWFLDHLRYVSRWRKPAITRTSEQLSWNLKTPSLSREFHLKLFHWSSKSFQCFCPQRALATGDWIGPVPTRRFSDPWRLIVNFALSLLISSATAADEIDSFQGLSRVLRKVRIESSLDSKMLLSLARLPTDHCSLGRRMWGGKLNKLK